MSYVFVNARRDWVPCLFGVTSARGPLCSVKVVDRMRQDSLYHFICKTQCNVCISVITIATILTTMAVMLIFRVIQNDSDKNKGIHDLNTNSKSHCNDGCCHYDAFGHSVY